MGFIIIIIWENRPLLVDHSQGKHIEHRLR